MADKLIKVSEEVHKMISKLANGSNESMKDYVESMAIYFEKNGVAPKSMEPSPAEEVKKLKDQLIRFIRTHEKKKITPILNDLELIIHDMRNKDGEIIHAIEIISKNEQHTMETMSNNAKEAILDRVDSAISKNIESFNVLDRKISTIANNSFKKDEVYQKILKEIYSRWLEFVEESKEEKFMKIWEGMGGRLDKYSKVFERICT